MRARRNSATSVSIGVRAALGRDLGERPPDRGVRWPAGSLGEPAGLLVDEVASHPGE
jgi:hypothetical protein